ncbi:Similar to lola: Longitudinals lacking protein [Cotesia congregata]|uniref:Isoforms J/P/Q/S/Z (Drosophila melanogaster) n=1 Tax=Cotesia congregata TaxID=51543 RepID=A0A8J2HJW8_COTCN|nr:Similar to lola: Longitudinals lacking protein [Cotesia congregata]
MIFNPVLRYISLRRRRPVQRLGLTHGYYKCPNNNCGRSYKAKGTLLTHLRYECGQAPRFMCAYCGFITSFKSNLRRHLNHLYISNVFIADKLYRRFVESPELDSGITESNYTDNFEISNNSQLVPEPVKTKTNTKRRNTKKKRKKYSCSNPGCSRVFKMKGCLKTHSMYCGKPLRFMCPLCKYRSKWNCYVKSHISRVHSGENASVIDVYKPSEQSEGRYLCPNDECRKKCSSKKILENHINFECEKLTQFKCYYCSFRAHFRDDVKEHSMREHKDKVCRVNLVIAQ